MAGRRRDWRSSTPLQRGCPAGGCGGLAQRAQQLVQTLRIAGHTGSDLSRARSTIHPSKVDKLSVARFRMCVSFR